MLFGERFGRVGVSAGRRPASTCRRPMAGPARQELTEPVRARATGSTRRSNCWESGRSGASRRLRGAPPSTRREARPLAALRPRPRRLESPGRRVLLLDRGPQPASGSIVVGAEFVVVALIFDDSRDRPRAPARVASSIHSSGALRQLLGASSTRSRLASRTSAGASSSRSSASAPGSWSGVIMRAVPQPSSGPGTGTSSWVLVKPSTDPAKIDDASSTL